jgi:hypothetical protein
VRWALLSPRSRCDGGEDAEDTGGGFGADGAIAYPGVLTGAASTGIKCVGVPMDGDGITATALDTILEEWDEAERGSHRPKLLLLVP